MAVMAEAEWAIGRAQALRTQARCAPAFVLHTARQMSLRGTQMGLAMVRVCGFNEFKERRANGKTCASERAERVEVMGQHSVPSPLRT